MNSTTPRTTRVAASTIAWLRFIDETHPKRHDLVGTVQKRVAAYTSENPHNGRLYLSAAGQSLIDNAQSEI